MKAVDEEISQLANVKGVDAQIGTTFGAKIGIILRTMLFIINKLASVSLSFILE